MSTPQLVSVTIDILAIIIGVGFVIHGIIDITSHRTKRGRK